MNRNNDLRFAPSREDYANAYRAFQVQEFSSGKWWPIRSFATLEEAELWLGRQRFKMRIKPIR